MIVGVGPSGPVGNGGSRPTPLSWASGFDGHDAGAECGATLERAFADVERADFGPGLFDDFAPSHRPLGSAKRLSFPSPV